MPTTPSVNRLTLARLWGEIRTKRRGPTDSSSSGFAWLRNIVSMVSSVEPGVNGSNNDSTTLLESLTDGKNYPRYWQGATHSAQDNYAERNTSRGMG